MLKKEHSFAIIAFVAPLITFSLTEKAFAEETSTKSVVKFSPDETSTGPVDPENGASTSPEGGGTPSAGALRIDYAPNFNFDTVALSVTQDKTYQAKYQRTTTNGVAKNLPNWITFTDGRGTAEGYDISVKATSFKNSTGDALNGAQINLKDLKITYPTGTGDDPTVADTSVNPIMLSSNAQTLVSAPPGKGTGQWNMTFGKETSANIPQEADTTARNSAVELYVPKNAKKVADNEYSSDIIWTIGSTPTSGS